ncbi:MAG TPA: hypothetical protein VGB82_08315 [Alphaproteobacteria bacterium]
MAAESTPTEPGAERAGKAKVWRDRAAKYRILARASSKPDAKQSLLRLAEDCERHAERVDARPDLA